jgi:hypothetical protein
MNRVTRFSILSIILLSFFAVSCDDNPVKDDNDNDHYEPTGLVLVQNGAEIAIYTDGESSGGIEVGVEKETSLISVRFIAEDGDRFVPEGDEFSLELERGDDIFEIEQHEGEDYEFHVIGEVEGNSLLTVKLMHNGHADFVAAPFEVHVETDGPGEDHAH